MAITAVHFYVTGQVQGVFYRASTCRKAQKLGLAGWVRNLPDGGVELVACGATDDVKALEKWLWKGPSAASVHDVVVEEIPVDATLDGFQVRR